MQAPSATNAPISMNPVYSSEAKAPDSISDREYADFLLREIEGVDFSSFYHTIDEFKNILTYLRLDQVLGLPDSKEYQGLKQEKIYLCALSAPSMEEAIETAHLQQDASIRESLLRSIEIKYSIRRSDPTRLLEGPANEVSIPELELLLDSIHSVAGLSKRDSLVQMCKNLPVENVEAAISLLGRGFSIAHDYLLLSSDQMFRDIPKELMSNPSFVIQMLQSDSYIQMYEWMKLSFLLRALSVMDQPFSDVQDRVFDILKQAHLIIFDNMKHEPCCLPNLASLTPLQEVLLMKSLVEEALSTTPEEPVSSNAHSHLIKLPRFPSDLASEACLNIEHFLSFCSRTFDDLTSADVATLFSELFLQHLDEQARSSPFLNEVD